MRTPSPLLTSPPFRGCGPNPFPLKNMKHRIVTQPRRILALGAAMLTGVLLLPAQPPGAGEISGRISSAETGKYLANVRVTVAGTYIRELTNSAGEYRLRGIPPGKVRIIASSTGTAQESAEVVVEPGKTVRKDLSLPLAGESSSAGGTVVKLDPFSVEASVLNARAVALNEQRYAANIKNVISADMFGDIGEGNIAEFLKFVPGVAIDYSANVGAGVSIRGFPASNTLVTVDGADVPSAGIASNQVPTNQLATRTISLDALRLNNISRIEVTKSPTPDLPANSMGGSVNVISKSAFELGRAEFEMKVFTTFNSRNFGDTKLDQRKGSRPELDARPLQPGFKFSYARPVSKNLGFTFSGGSFLRNYAYRSASTSWNLDGANAVLGTATIDAQEQLFKSTDAALSAEWRMGEYSTLKAGGLYVDTTTHISDNRFTVEFGSGVMGGADFVQGSPAASGLAEMANPLGAKVNGKTIQGTLDYTFKRDDWVIRASGFTSRNLAEQQDISQGFFNRVDLVLGGLVVRGEGLYRGMPNSAIPLTLSATSAAGTPIDLFNGGLYLLSRVISRPMTTTDAKSGAKLDATRHFGQLFTLRAGAAYNSQVRDTLHDFKRYDFNAAAAGGKTAGNFGFVDPAYSATAQNYYTGHQVQWVSLAKVYDLFQAHPEYFTLNESASYSSSIRYSPKLEESITAGYLRADLKLLKDRLWLVGGVRYERTDDKGAGPLQDFEAIYQKDAKGKPVRDANGNLIPIASGFAATKLLWTYRGQKTRRNYDDFFPSFNATYNISDDLLIRGAYAKSIGRPELQRIIPGTVIADPSAAPQNRIITVVNSGLLPWTSDGYDLSLEYYGKKWGVASVGVFQKDIKNFFGGTRERATPQMLELLNVPEDYPGQYDTYDVVTTMNVTGNVRIHGIELSYQNSLAPLGKLFRNLSCFANATFLDLEGSNDSDFSGYWPKTFNWGLSYASPRLLVQLNWNVKPANPLQPKGSDPTRPIAWSNSRAVVSAAVEYRFAKHLSVYFTADNLTDVPRVSYRYGSLTPDYAKNSGISAFGTDMTLGIKAKF